MKSLEESLSHTSTPVDQTVDDEDGMVDGAREYYFASGQSALRAIRLSLAIAEAPDPRRILDLPCGHGRVLRYLRAAFPDADLTASDVLENGVRFCQQRFGARGVVAHTDPEQTPLSGEFDLIWCGSLLTHLSLPGWESLARVFHRHLAPGGLMVSTLHGRWVAERLRGGDSYGLRDDARESLLQDYERTGFAYQDYPGTPGYGISLSRLSWAASQVERLPDMRLLWAGEQSWDGHQDVLVSQKVDSADL